MKSNVEQQLHSLEEDTYQLEHLYEELKGAVLKAEVRRPSKNVSFSSAGQKEVLTSADFFLKDDELFSLNQT